MKKIILFIISIFAQDMQPKTYICSSVYCDQKGDESIFPNSNSILKSSSLKFQAIYWECACVMFATSKRLNGDAVHLLFSNKAQAPEPYQTLLHDMGVTVAQLPFNHKPPAGWHHKYKNSVYTLDIVQYLAQALERDDVAILLDADTLWIQSADAFVEKIREKGVLHYNLNYKAESEINGITLGQAQTIYGEVLGEPLNELPQHTGGELVAATGHHLNIIAGEIEPLWDTMLQRFSAHKNVFTTEEHFLSFIYHKLQYRENANDFIRRIGTDKNVMRTVIGDEHNLLVWHLPAEKSQGFKRLCMLAQDTTSIFWSVPLGSEFISLCAYLCNVMP
jgi:hypothetical protein